MRSLFSLLFVLLATALFSQQITSRFTSRDRGWTTFGIDGGWAYQSSDVRTTFEGWGAGLTLGKNLAYRPGGALSFDIRGRALFTRSYGRDWQRVFDLEQNTALNGDYSSSLNYILDKSNPIDSSFVYANHRTGMGELGVEGVLTFNRLRERTGVVLSLFGGVGVDLYRTRIDQLDGDGNRYNYFSVDNSNGKASTITQLDRLRDGVYESRADGSTGTGLRAGIMPGAGVELGYQLGRKFVVGVGHKVTFSRTDVLDGQRWYDGGIATNDWAHYTNIFMRWDIGKASPRMKEPIIEITDPNKNPYISDESTVFVRANIRNVNSSADVRCYLNGEARGFEFRNGKFGTNVRLREGRNELRIEAFNPVGADEETLILFREERSGGPRQPAQPPTMPPAPSTPAPVVRITNPSYSPFNTDRAEIYLRAEVQNVRERRELRLLLNGVEENFTLAEGLESSLRLRQGRNVVRVEANTAGGRASDEVVIEVGGSTQPPTNPPSNGRRPIVTIVQPSSPTASTRDRNYNFSATVKNVDSRDNITLLQNGQPLRDFSFSPSSGVLTAELALNPNENPIVVRARNSSGEAEATATITRTGGIVAPPTPTNSKPSVTITEPANGAEFDRSNVSFRAATQHVGGKNEVIVVFNGANVSNFNFNTNTQIADGALTLREGENTLTVRVTNAGGSSEATSRVRYNKPVSTPKPAVTITAPTDGREVREATTTLSATVTNVTIKSDVSVYLNGAAVTTFDFGRNGAVTASITLKDGENTLRVTARNSAGSDEKTVKVRYAKPVAVPKPTVTITAPADGSEVKTAASTLSAKVTNVTAKSDVSVYLNGAAVSSFDYARGGQISAAVTLKEGENTLRVTARNSSGTDEKTVKVRYSKPVSVPKPTVTITAPADGSEVKDAAVTLNAKVTGVTNKSDISVYLNGASVTTFDFTLRGGLVTAPVTLKEGENTLRVTARNSAGTDEKTVKVRYAKPAPAPKPTVVFTSPTKPVTVTKNGYQFVAKITNVKDLSEVKVYLNGSIVRRGLNYNDRLKELTYNATLVAGKNTLKITADNGAGSAEATAEVTFTANNGPLPEVDIQSASQPTADPFNPNVAKTSVVANLKNVTDKNQISITSNGKVVSGFNYNATTGLFTCVVNLDRGNNVIVVTATTPAGTASDTTSVKWE